MSEKITVEDAAERLEAIARARRVQDAIGEMVDRVEIANRLGKASGLEEMGAFTGGDVVSDPEGALSGAAVVRSLAEMCKNRPKPAA